VGFSAERLLSPIMDKVMNRLFITAEKSEPSPGTTPSGAALHATHQPTPAEQPGAESPDTPRRAEQGASG
jgi:hypothetical protein